MSKRKRELLDWCLDNLADWPYDVLDAPTLRGARFVRSQPREMPMLIAQDGTVVSNVDFFYARRARGVSSCSNKSTRN